MGDKRKGYNKSVVRYIVMPTLTWLCPSLCTQALSRCLVRLRLIDYNKSFATCVQITLMIWEACPARSAKSCNTWKVTAIPTKPNYRWTRMCQHSRTVIPAQLISDFWIAYPYTEKDDRRLILSCRQFHNLILLMLHNEKVFICIWKPWC